MPTTSRMPETTPSPPSPRPFARGTAGPIGWAVGGLLLTVLLAAPGHAQQGEESGGEETTRENVSEYANPHGIVVSFLFPGLPFRVLDLSREQKIRMARYTARLHRGYGHDLHHLYHGGGPDGLFRRLPHLRQQVRTYRRQIVDEVLTRKQRKELAAAFDEESFRRNRHGYRVLRAVLGEDAIHDYYGISDRHGVGTHDIGFKDAHGAGDRGRDHGHGGGPPPR